MFIRMLEERRNMLINISNLVNRNGSESEDKERRADEMNIHIERLKGILNSISLNEPND